MPEFKILTTFDAMWFVIIAPTTRMSYLRKHCSFEKIPACIPRPLINTSCCVAETRSLHSPSLVYIVIIGFWFVIQLTGMPIFLYTAPVV